MTDKTSHHKAARQTAKKAGAERPAFRGRPLIGAQISTAGGFSPVPERAVAIGAEVVQIFPSNPRMWRRQPRTPEEIAALKAGLEKHRLPLFLHTIYLLNLASPDEALRARSEEVLAETLVMSAKTGSAAVVTHIGSHRGDGFDAALPRIVSTIRAALERARLSLEEEDRHGHAGLPSPLLLEVGAGSGDTVGGRLDELAALLAELPPSCGVCLDTAHLFAAGYSVHTGPGLERLLEEMRQLRILEKVGLMHLNDSKAPFASKRDQHDNPGEGHIGRSGLVRVVRHPAFAGIPFVLEVPGADGRGPDAPNVALVKRMREGPAGPPTRPVRRASRQGGPA